MSKSCACSSARNPAMLLPCSGGSNVGQISNQAAVELTREGFGSMFCLAGIGGHIEPMIKMVQDAPKVIVIDGCPVGCAKKTMEAAGLPVDNYVLLTDLGIEKVKDRALAWTDEEVRTAKQAIRAAALGTAPAGLAPSAAGCGCGCSG